MRRIAFAVFAATQLCASAVLAETRCGYVNNPTPGNYSLIDSQGEWIMVSQGQERDPGMDQVPDLSEHDFVKTNGAYGYACGCISGDFDAAAMQVAKIASFRQKPLAACRKDKNLKAPD